MSSPRELVVQAELHSHDATGHWITMGWFPVGLRLGTEMQRDGLRWVVAKVYPAIVRDLEAERQWK